MKTWLCAFTLAAATGTASQAQDEAPRPPWLVGCSNQADPGALMCEMSQSIVLSEGNQRLATVALQREAGADELTGVFTLPVGLYLPAGLRIGAGETELGTVAFESCDGQGCYASAPVPADWLDAIAGAEVLTLSIDRPDREVLNLGFDLTGFSDVFSLMP